VYENKMNFDISELNDISAPQFAFYMKLGKSGEKYKKITDTVESIIPEATQQKTTEQDAITQITEEKQQKSWKPSFNCDKARTFIEKSICSERLLGNMDGAMAENYQYMMASNIGDGARNDLKSTQKQWILERNKCTSIQCIELAYRKRIDEICEYPVISGIHPICTMSDEIK
ncbi:MAG: DUF1311 domain-containing protein, partial [Betaproteobacteria bacterium]|nr:DUF1311 domain-containing protein [Betaproteobacteria bacterium]